MLCEGNVTFFPHFFDFFPCINQIARIVVNKFKINLILVIFRSIINLPKIEDNLVFFQPLILIDITSLITKKTFYFYITVNEFFFISFAHLVIGQQPCTEGKKYF